MRIITIETEIIKPSPTAGILLGERKMERIIQHQETENEDYCECQNDYLNNMMEV